MAGANRCAVPVGLSRGAECSVPSPGILALLAAAASATLPVVYQSNDTCADANSRDVESLIVCTADINI